MFARSVSMRLRTNSVAELNRLIETEALPLLRKQKGFKDEIMLVAPGGTDAVAISLLDQKENAAAYKVNVLRVHLKRDASQRLTLCGIFPRDTFKLIDALPKLSKKDQDAICKVCLKASKQSKAAGVG
jgi:hypothetical protein